MNTFSVDKATTIRYPSTANLMIDSQDGPKDSSGIVRLNPWDFQIYKPQQLQNGFFTRIATSEVVLEWNNPNISADLSSNILVFDISGVSHTIDFLPGFYTVEQLLLQMKELFDAVAAPVVMDINYNPAAAGEIPCNISFGGIDVTFQPTNLSFMLGLSQNPNSTFYLVNVDLRPYRYLDFVSPDLTYAQDTKDGSTNNISRDVLCRWYFCYDNATPTIDAYGFPILMGYTPFFIRRLYNPPKQIKWDNNLPVGALRFQVYGITTFPFDDKVNNQIVVKPSYDGKSNWLMTLQLSEN